MISARAITLHTPRIEAVPVPQPETMSPKTAATGASVYSNAKTTSTQAAKEEPKVEPKVDAGAPDAKYAGDSRFDQYMRDRAHMKADMENAIANMRDVWTLAN